VTSPPILPPQLVAALSGNYELLQEIDRGGMGIVYAGRDVRLDRLVAIKVLPELVSSDVVRERFLREARAAARLSHPSIVPIYTADDRNGVTFMVMAFVDGTTLSTRLRDGSYLQPADAVPILRDVALALNAAHSRGVAARGAFDFQGHRRTASGGARESRREIGCAGRGADRLRSLSAAASVIHPFY
jgi:serine/threonine-protein kinase